MTQRLTGFAQESNTRFVYKKTSGAPEHDTSLELLSYGGTISNTTENNVEPLRVAIVTSIRDVGACDQNGRMVNTRRGQQYMMGIPEALHIAIEEHGFPARISGIITDDSPLRAREIANMDGYAVSPHHTGDWIHDRDLGSAHGETLASITHNIPSDFRFISGQKYPEAKAESKTYFEDQLWQVFNEMGADVLISDHLMMRLHNILADSRLGIGRGLNIHPAITQAGHPLALRGKTPTQEAIDNAQETGEFWTGATFHVMNRVIDDGPLLAHAAPTIVGAQDTPQQLRARNYPGAKIPVFLQGLQHYIERVYPYLDQINWDHPQTENVPLSHLSNLL